jgi:Flp pilus assembly pilin Flp
MSRGNVLFGRRPSPTRALLRDARGVVTTEYVIVVGAVGLVVVGALVGIGPKLVAGYQHARGTLSQPFP